MFLAPLDVALAETQRAVRLMLPGRLLHKVCQGLRLYRLPHFMSADGQERHCRVPFMGLHTPSPWVEAHAKMPHTRRLLRGTAVHLAGGGEGRRLVPG